jgi:type II secretory pathway component PulJ
MATDLRHRERGFTITEMLVAMGILTFGTVSLLGVLGVGVSTHRSAEQHNNAVQLAQRVLQRLEEDTVPRALLAAAEAGPEAEFKLAAVDSTPQDVAGCPGMRYRVEFTHDPEQPTLALAKVRVVWLEQGEAQAVDFQRILVSHVPFPQRIARLRARKE